MLGLGVNRDRSARVAWAAWLVLLAVGLVATPTVARADRAKVTVTGPGPKHGLRDDVRSMHVRPGKRRPWHLSLSVGNAWPQNDHSAVDPNGVAIGVDARFRFEDAPLYLGAELVNFSGHDARGEEPGRGRLRGGVIGGVYGRLGDFDLQLGLGSGLLLAQTESRHRSDSYSAEMRAYLSPSVRLMRQVTDTLALGVDSGYLVVTREANAAWVQLAATLRF